MSIFYRFFSLQTSFMLNYKHIFQEEAGRLLYNIKTHSGRVTHICVGNLTIIGSENGLSPGRRQAIIWTNAGSLLIGPLGTNFSEVIIEIHAFSFKKMYVKRSSAKWWPFCLGLNVLIILPIPENLKHGVELMCKNSGRWPTSFNLLWFL